MLLISRRESEALLDMREAVETLESAFARYGEGECRVPVRLNMGLSDKDALGLYMPSYLAPGGAHQAALGVKIVTLFADNPARGLPYIIGVFLLQDPDTGTPLALMEANFLTAFRTGAATGLAARFLARPEASVAGLIGAGGQAVHQLLGLAAVLPLERALVYDLNTERAAAFARTYTERYGLPVEVVSSPEGAAREAHVLVTATTSHTPVFPGRVLTPGIHVTSIGAFEPERRELDAEAVGRARVFVDTYEANRSEAGNLIGAEAEGAFSWESIRGDLAQLCRGEKPGRTDPEEITLFNSVGCALEDVAIADLLYRKARAAGRGVQADLFE